MLFMLFYKPYLLYVGIYFVSYTCQRVSENELYYGHSAISFST